MAKKNADKGTIENRVYLFKDIAAAFVAAHGASLVSSDLEKRNRVMRALGDIAHASCVVADSEEMSPEQVAALVAKGPS